MSEPDFIALPALVQLNEDERLRRVRAFAEELNTRRTIREFSDRPVARAVIEQCLRAAGTAPSGANQQPWRFVAVADPKIKSKIRIAAEAEEHEFYTRRAPEEWLSALAPLGTDEQKPFLEIAPWLIAVFYERFGLSAEGEKSKRYYPHESVGLACGMLIAALHRAGLAALTHTPSPMGFLNEILSRPKNEMPYLLLVVGHPAEHCKVPNIRRLDLSEYVTFI